MFLNAESLEQLLSVLGGLVDEIGGNVFNGVVIALLGFAAPGECAHSYKIDDTKEINLIANRKLQHERGGTETRDNHVDAAVEICTGAIELIHKANTRDAVLIRLTPHCLGLRLDASNSVEHCDCAVEHTK